LLSPLALLMLLQVVATERAGELYITSSMGSLFSRIWASNTLSDTLGLRYIQLLAYTAQ
jgi:hypothetical protein